MRALELAVFANDGRYEELREGLDGFAEALGMMGLTLP